MKRVAILALAALSLAGCASSGIGRAMSYGTNLADAKFDMEGRDYAVWVHDKDDTLLVQRRVSGAMVGKAALEGLTLNIVDLSDVNVYWRRAAEQFLRPVGCDVAEVYPLDRDTSWEAAFKCPEAVDLRSLVKAQREGLRRGEPLQP